MNIRIEDKFKAVCPTGSTFSKISRLGLQIPGQIVAPNSCLDPNFIMELDPDCNLDALKKTANSTYKKILKQSEDCERNNDCLINLYTVEWPR
jgi:hypothetical protein